MNEIVERIYELLAESGMTKREFSRRIGVSKNTLQNWKNDESYPSLSVILRVCEAMKISYGQFFAGIQTPQTEEEKFLNLWRLLKEDEKKEIVKVLENFSEKKEQT